MRMPVIFIISIVLNNVKLLGYFPTTAGISENISPRLIMTDKTLNYNRHIAIPFGQYFQINEEDIPHNITKPRTRSDIFLVTAETNKLDSTL